MMSDLSLVDWGDSISIYKGEDKVLLKNDELQKLVSYLNTRMTDWMLAKIMKVNEDE